MTETVAGDAAHGRRAWWLEWPPSVDEAVLHHGRAVAWLAATGLAASVFLWWFHAGVLGCDHSAASPCGTLALAIDPWLHAVAWTVGAATGVLVLLSYARIRHAIRRWRRAVPYAPRRTLLMFAVDEGTLAQREFERLEVAYAEIMSGDTFSERLHIRADVLTAVGWALGAVAALSLVALILALGGDGGAAATALAAVTLVLGGAATWLVLVGRRVGVMAFDAGKWERHTAHVLLERALAKLKVKPSA